MLTSTHPEYSTLLTSSVSTSALSPSALAIASRGSIGYAARLPLLSLVVLVPRPRPRRVGIKVSHTSNANQHYYLTLLSTRGVLSTCDVYQYSEPSCIFLSCLCLCSSPVSALSLAPRPRRVGVRDNDLNQPRHHHTA